MAAGTKVLIGAGVVTLVVALLARRASARPGGRVLVLHTNTQGVQDPNDLSIFVSNADRVANRLGTRRIPVQSGQDVLNALRTVPDRSLRLLIMIGHGGTGSFFTTTTYGIRARGGDALPAWVGAQTFARTLAPKLTAGAIVSLAGCRSGADPGEPDWNPANLQRGGANSMAAVLRDQLALAGAPRTEIRAHTTTGRVLDNPRGRAFRTDEHGLPGRPVTPERGEPARRWMMGLS